MTHFNWYLSGVARRISTIMWLAGLLVFAGCNKEKEEDPFKGTDSAIIALSLQQGETVFHAAIAGEDIILTVPEGFSLVQAKAAVKLSENATIYPDPAKITDWDEEHQFVVTAYNGTQTTYKYSVTRRGVVYNGTVTLQTQAEVDAFGQQGATLIEGSLTIGRITGTDSITSLAPLAGLKTVVYNLTIHPTFAGAELTGLDALEQVSGSFTIGALKHLEILTLPALKTVGSFDLVNTVTFIAGFPELTRVKTFRLNCPLYQLQMPRLQYAGRLTFTAASNANTSLTTVSLPALEEMDGALSITALHSITKINLPVLRKTGGLTLTTMNQLSFVYAPRLEEITGTVTIVSVPSLTEFGLPELTKAGTFTINSTALNLLAFPKLGEITSLGLTSLPVGMFTGGFPALQTAGTVTLTNLSGGTLTIPATVQHIGRLTVSASAVASRFSEINIKGKNIGILDLRSFAAETKIIGDDAFNGALLLSGSSAINSFPELEGLTEIDSLNVSLSGLANLYITGIRKVRRGVDISSTSSSVKDFSMPDMEEIGAGLRLHLPYMTSSTITALELPKLKSVGGSFTMNVMTKTVETLRFPELTTVGGLFNLTAGYDYSSNAGFKSMEFPKLATVGGKLTIHSGSTSRNNTKLTNLDGFAALASVGSIEITRQAALEDYEGLKELFKTLPAEKWITPTNNAYNPTYQELKEGKWTK
jgi:hypothetical protein